MGYRSAIDASRGVVEIRLFGALSHDEHLAAREELLQTCRARQLRGVLVDARDLVLAHGSSFMDLFDFAESWPDLAGEPRIMVAGLLPRHADTRRQVMFGDTVATNRGLLTRAFDDIEEARAWLRDAGSRPGS